MKVKIAFIAVALLLIASIAQAGGIQVIISVGGRPCQSYWRPPCGPIYSPPVYGYGPQYYSPQYFQPAQQYGYGWSQNYGPSWNPGLGGPIGCNGNLGAIYGEGFQDGRRDELDARDRRLRTRARNDGYEDGRRSVQQQPWPWR